MKFYGFLLLGLGIFAGFISTLMFAMGGLALVAAIFVIPGVDVFIVSLAVMIISYYSCIKAFKDIIIINKKEKNIKR